MGYGRHHRVPVHRAGESMQSSQRRCISLRIQLPKRRNIRIRNVEITAAGNSVPN